MVLAGGGTELPNFHFIRISGGDAVLPGTLGRLAVVRMQRILPAVSHDVTGIGIVQEARVAVVKCTICLCAPQHLRDRLRLQAKIPLALANGLLGTLAFLDIGVDAVPLHDLAGSVEDRAAAEQEPAILAVEAAQPRLEFAGTAGRQDALPVCAQSLQIVRMHGARVAPAKELLGNEAGVV